MTSSFSVRVQGTILDWPVENLLSETQNYMGVRYLSCIKFCFRKFLQLALADVVVMVTDTKTNA